MLKMSFENTVYSDLISSKFLCFKIRWIQKLKIYKTHNRLYVVGSNIAETKYRILKIDRTEPWELVIIEDGIDYTKEQMADTVTRLYGGNSTATKWKKGLEETISAHGIVGFVRFLEGYYMIIITKQQKVAEIGGHSIYKIEDTMMIYLPNSNIRQAHSDEARYLKIFQTVDLSSNFYFSYSYDLTNTLQHNMVQLHKSTSSTAKDTAEILTNPYSNRRGRTALPCGRFVWNNYLTEPLASRCISSLWILPIIHGHITQSCINVYGQLIYITLVGRRSCLYAGTRFMKRGCNIKGDVANEVETEQIVHCASTSSIHHASFTSFVQHRGSVPVHWQQDITANVVPSKPPITITNDNPYAQATAKHFKHMIERFGTPVTVLNLVRKREKRFRESILGCEYKCAIDYLNQFLKSDQQIEYFAVDMAHLARGRKANVLAKLARIAEHCLQATGFFQSKPDLFQDTLNQDSRWQELGGRRLCGYRVQTGVLRTNCVDCLDRTNSAQFIAGKCALAYQLYSLGVLSEPDIHFETDATRLYEEMFEAHGDTVALQYGGSQLVHTIQSYRRTVAPWASHSRDIVTTISRYYTNTFSDADKQSAINLFLGVFRPASARESLWDISTDHYLHNQDADVLESLSIHNYTRWWDPEGFCTLPLPFEMVKSIEVTKQSSEDSPCHKRRGASEGHCKDCTDWYEDLHNPSQLTVFEDVFALNLTSTYTRNLSTSAPDDSPFAVRSEKFEQFKEEDVLASPAHSFASLDESLNESTESDDVDVLSKQESFDFDQVSSCDRASLPPWLRTPTLEDFSPKVAYGIDLDNYAAEEDAELYGSYVSCSDLDNEYSKSTECESDASLYMEPLTVDPESLKLYKESVCHTYRVDHQFYVDYLARCEPI